MLRLLRLGIQLILVKLTSLWVKTWANQDLAQWMAATLLVILLWMMIGELIGTFRKPRQ